MRILITGATGFLGSAVVPLLQGHDVRCLTRRPGALPTRGGLGAIEGDLMSAGPWMDELHAFRPEWCLHLAWDGLPDYSLDRCRRNLDAGVRLIDLLASAGTSRLVVAGSCWEYGQASGAMAESALPQQPGVFASTKLALLTLLDSVSRHSTLEYRWARVFFVYGPGQRPTSLIPSLTAAFASRRQPEIRQPGAAQDFVHIDDVAEGFVALTLADIASGTYNVGSGVPATVAEVANRVADRCGRARPFAALPEAIGFWADMTKTTAATGWCPRIGLDEGVASTLTALQGVA